MNTERKASNTRALVLATLILSMAFCVSNGRAADPSRELPTRAELRSELKRLPPSERDARITELRQRYGSSGPLQGGRRGAYGSLNRGVRQRMERMPGESKTMTPAEREARIAELRRRRDRSLKQPQEGVRGTSEIGQLTLAQREEFLKLRRQLRELPEAERQAKLREFFSKLGTNTADGAKSPADRAQQFRLMRERMEARIKLLEGKLADGSISETEKRQLERMQRFRRDRPD